MSPAPLNHIEWFLLPGSGAEKVAALQRELRSEREGRRKAEMEVVRLSEEIERIQAEREVNGTPQPRRSPRRIGAKGKGMK